MTARGEASPRADAAAREQKDKDRLEIGWGLMADDSGEEIRVRKVIFAISVAVVGCLGAWILFTSALSGRRVTPVLSATGSDPGAAVFYTVMLLKFDGPERKVVEQIVASERVKALAGEGNEFRFVNLSSGQHALCVGRSNDEDSPHLRLLVRKFGEFRTRTGGGPFQSAVICACPE